MCLPAVTQERDASRSAFNDLPPSPLPLPRVTRDGIHEKSLVSELSVGIDADYRSHGLQGVAKARMSPGHFCEVKAKTCIFS